MAAVDKAADVATQVVDDVKDRVASKSSLSGVKSFISGGFGGICAVLVGKVIILPRIVRLIPGHPFDLVKVRLQTAQTGVYSGMMDCVRKTIARDGARGLYAGVTAPLYGVTPIFAVSFWGYDVGKGLVRQSLNLSPDQTLTTGQMAAAGFISAVPTTVLTAPFERIKVVLQVQDANPSATTKKYNGTFDAIRGIYKDGGLRSVFRGSLATIARDGPGFAAYFATYEVVKKSLTPVAQPGQQPQLSITAVMVAGGLAGTAMWTAIFPIDTVKSQLQSGGNDVTIGKVLRSTYARGGVKAFFPGLAPALLRSFPANAATFLGVELAKNALDKVL